MSFNTQSTTGNDSSYSVVVPADNLFNGTRIYTDGFGAHDQFDDTHSQPGLGQNDYPGDWMNDVVDEFKRGLYTYEEPRTIVLITIYGIIFLMALGGNVLVLLVMAANNSMRNVTNFFLLNLALSDLLGSLHLIFLLLSSTLP